MKIININCLTSNPPSTLIQLIVVASISITKNNHKFDIYFLIINFYCSYFLCAVLFMEVFMNFWIFLEWKMSWMFTFNIENEGYGEEIKWFFHLRRFLSAVKIHVNTIFQKHNYLNFISENLLCCFVWCRKSFGKLCNTFDDV